MGKLSHHEVLCVKHAKEVIEFFPGLVQSKFPKEEAQQLANIFINQFLKANGDCPFEFRAEGWIHSISKMWWTRLVMHITTKLRDILIHDNLLVLFWLSSMKFSKIAKISLDCWSTITWRFAHSSLMSKK